MMTEAHILALFDDYEASITRRTGSMERTQAMIEKRGSPGFVTGPTIARVVCTMRACLIARGWCAAQLGLVLATAKGAYHD